MRLISFLLLISLGSILSIEFFALSDIEDPELIRQIHTQILSEQRQLSVENLNQSIETDTFGKIMGHAADVLTTDVTLVSTRISRPLLAQKQPTEVIVRTSYLIENSDESPTPGQRFLRYRQSSGKQWTYSRDASIKNFYMNLFRFD